MVKKEGTLLRGARTEVVSQEDPSLRGLTSEILSMNARELLSQTSQQLFRLCFRKYWNDRKIVVLRV